MSNTASDPQQGTGPASPGWYDDPAAPGHDRWWNGYQWTEATARTPSPSMFGPWYQRTLRSGLNVRARVAGLFADGGAIFTILSLLALAFWRTEPRGLLIMMLAFAALCGMVAIVVGIRAAQTPAAVGGRGAAIRAIIVGAISGVFPALALFGIVLLASAVRR